MEITKITSKKEISKDLFNDIWFFHIAEYGAMGAPGEVIAVKKEGECFSYNYISSDITFEDTLILFPPLKEFTSFVGDTVSLPKGWQHIYTGFGNHLLVSDEIYDKFYEESKEIIDSYKIYGLWMEKAEKVINEIIK